MKLLRKLNLQRHSTVGLMLLTALVNQTFAQSAAPAATASLSATETEFANGIKIETIKNVTAALSAPEMQGRGTMQPGGERAANYIADRFRQLGLKPLGDRNSYLQNIKFKESVFAPETALKIGDETLKMGEDYVVQVNTGSENASGDLVFVAYAIQADSIKRDDLAGVDVRGKIVVMLDGPPANIAKETWEKQKAGSLFFRNLVMKGVAGIITIQHGREERSYGETAQYAVRRQISLPDEEGFPDFVPPILAASNKTAEKLFASSGVTLKDALAQAESTSFKPIKLKQQAKITVKWKATNGTAPNVVGVMEGADPKLKEEAVLFTAHYDAFGVGADGKFYPGAADNALGVAEMIAVAEAFAKSPVKPKRSLVFLAVTGEEYGLYGSKYWAKNPTWDIKKVAADLNLDGVGTEIYAPVKTIVGYGAEHSSLGAIMSDVAAAMKINVLPDPFPSEKIFYRSDHYSFVERGVPSLMLLGAPAGDKEIWIKRMKDWEKTDYHNAGDTIKPDWAWDGAKTVADVMGIMGLRLANSEKMPEWSASSRFAKLERGNTKELPEEN
jgi:hypothetical protein